MHMLVLSLAIHVAAATANHDTGGTDPVELEVTLRPDHGEGFFANFGAAAAIRGDWLAVGAPGDGGIPNDSGVYFFHRDLEGWVEKQYATLPYTYNLGASIATDGDTVIAGNTQNNPVAVFKRDGLTWNLDQYLPPTGLGPHSGFGVGVAVSGSFAAVGAPQDNYPFKGAVLVYALANPYGAPRVLTPPDGLPQENFGQSVAMDGDTLVVGAPNDRPSGIFSGSAYVYRFDGYSWLLTQKLVPSDASSYPLVYTKFGNAVSVHGGHLAVGAVNYSRDGTIEGAVYVYERNGDSWVETQKLLSSEHAAYESFGASVAVDDDRIVVVQLGASYQSVSRLYVYALDGGTWNLFQEVTPVSEQGFRAVFGKAVGVSDDRVFASNPDVSYKGAVYVYEPRSNHPPLANAGPDRFVECDGASIGIATLDGSSSSDPDSTPGTSDDIASYVWSEGGTSVATGVTASVPFQLGPHDVTLTVSDNAGATDSDDTLITVQDTLPPSGRIVAPDRGACFGPLALPVTVTDDFTDVCDPTVLRAYQPAPGPSYSRHGDYHVALVASDASGNAVSVSVDFTIDAKRPVVNLVSPLEHALLVPGSLPFRILLRDSDDDGAAGGVVHEVIELDGCPIFDGLTYGNEDGLLSDEAIMLGAGELCRAAAACGFTVLNQPELRVEATDCGGNVGADARRFTGRLALRPGICGK